MRFGTHVRTPASLAWKPRAVPRVLQRQVGSWNHIRVWAGAPGRWSCSKRKELGHRALPKNVLRRLAVSIWAVFSPMFHPQGCA